MKKFSSSPAALHFPVRLNETPPQGREIVITANERQRAELARIAKLVKIDRLEAKLVLKPRGKQRLHASGEVEADVVYTCVLTLEPFSSHISEKISVTYASGETHAKVQDLAFDADPPERLVDGQADIGALVREFFMLALDPYPRKPGAHFEAVGETARPIDAKQ